MDQKVIPGKTGNWDFEYNEDTLMWTLYGPGATELDVFSGQAHTLEEAVHQAGARIQDFDEVK